MRCLSPYLAYMVPVSLSLITADGGLTDFIWAVWHCSISPRPSGFHLLLSTSVFVFQTGVAVTYASGRPRFPHVNTCNISFASVHRLASRMSISLLLSFSWTCSVKQIRSIPVQDKQFQGDKLTCIRVHSIAKFVRYEISERNSSVGLAVAFNSRPVTKIVLWLLIVVTAPMNIWLE